MDTSPSRPEVQKLLQSIGGQLAYLTTSSLSDLSFCSAHLSHISPENITTDDCKFLNSSVRKAKIHRHIVLPKLEVESIYIAGYAVAGFANNRDLTSQLGFIVLLKDKHDNAAIFNYGSWKCRCVTRSVSGFEVHACSHCFDYTLGLSKDLSTMLGRNSIPLYLPIQRAFSIQSQNLVLYLRSVFQSILRPYVKIARAVTYQMWLTFPRRTTYRMY